MYQALDQDAQQRITGTASQYEKQYQVLSAFAAGNASEAVLNQTIQTIKARPVRRAFEAARDNLKGLVSDVEFKRFANKAGQQRLERMMLATSPAAVPSNYVAALFSSSEQGTWYDPSDLSTLFQDSAGTTPVTAVEQPVGLMLDKSKGLVLGSELVTNGDFSNGTTGYIASNATLSVVSGSLRVTSTTAGIGLCYTANIPVVAGKVYKLSVDCDSGTGSSRVLVGSGGGNGAFFSESAGVVGNRTLTCFFTPTGSVAVVSLIQAVATLGAYANFDNISVRELPGNHAYQATATSRPVLSSRYNLLTKTEQFDDAAWTKLNAAVTANAIVSPDGTLTADKLVEDAANAQHAITSTSYTATASEHTISIYAKESGRSRFVIYFKSVDAAQGGATFDLAAVTATVNFGTNATASITSVGNGWYRCVLTATLAASTNNAKINLLSGGSASYTGDGTSGIYIWGASLVHANQSNLPYQRVNTATDYDTVGFKPYLKFDGVDDFLQTNSIDFTSTDKMHVCAGVRKLANGGMIFETSTDSSANNGSVWMYAGTPSYEAAFRGTVFVNVTATGINPPRTDILSSQGSITPANNVLRVNGTQAAQSTSTQGTGNFGNYPIYIGRRGGTALPFNGQLYGLIIRGAASTDAQIAATERYINGKTGAY